MWGDGGFSPTEVGKNSLTGPVVSSIMVSDSDGEAGEGKMLKLSCRIDVIRFDKSKNDWLLVAKRAYSPKPIGIGSRKTRKGVKSLISRWCEKETERLCKKHGTQDLMLTTTVYE